MQQQLFPIILQVATTMATNNEEVLQEDYLKDMASMHNYSLSIEAAKIITFLLMFYGYFLAFSTPDYKVANAFQSTKKGTSQINIYFKWLLTAIGYDYLSYISTRITASLLLYASEYFTTTRTPQAIALDIPHRTCGTIIRF